MKTSIEALFHFVSLFAYEDDNGISILTVTKHQFYEYPINVALVYQSPNIPVAGFLDQLTYFTNARKINMLLSDACGKLHDILSNYRLVVKQPSHLVGTLLDHVYLHKLFLSQNVNEVVKKIYFSDHDAEKLQILVAGNDDIHFERTM